MAKPTMKRWVCPSCGSGALAPSRPRKDDVRRYCLTCSASTGRLVARTCPSVDATRERKAAARKDAAARRREREAAALTERHRVGDLDVRTEWARLCRLAFVRGKLPGGRTPPLTVAWSKVKDYTTGHAWYGSGRTHFTFYSGCTEAEAKALMAHELAHVISPDRGHGEAFRRTFALVLLHGYGVPVESWRPLEGTKYENHEAAERVLMAHEGVWPDTQSTRREDERLEAIERINIAIVILLRAGPVRLADWAHACAPYMSRSDHASVCVRCRGAKLTEMDADGRIVLTRRGRNNAQKNQGLLVGEDDWRQVLVARGAI